MRATVLLPAIAFLLLAATLPAAANSGAPVFDTPQLNVVNGARLKGIKRVAVASFTVQFTEAQLGEVRTTGGNLGSIGNVSLKQVVSKTVGVDFTAALPRERMQEATNMLHRDLLATLKEAGLEVVPPEQLRASSHFRAFTAAGATAPRVEDAEAQKGVGQGAIRSVFMTPPDLPLIIKGGSGGESIDYLNSGDSIFSSAVTDHTLTFAGRLGLYTSSFRWQEMDLQKELDTATLHVRVFVPLAIIEVDSGLNWSKAKIEPGVLLGKRFTRMTVGNDGEYAYIFLKDNLKVPGVIDYQVVETPHPNALRAMLGEKVRTYPATMDVERYWNDVPTASRHVFQAFARTLADSR